MSDPYLDADGAGWMVTLSQQVPNSKTEMVAAGDILIDTIQSDILSMKFLQSGYAFLVNSNFAVVAHPLWNKDSPTTLATLDSELSEELRSITGGDNTFSGSGLRTVTLDKNNKKGEWYMAYATTPQNQIVVLVAPRDEAVTALDSVDTETDKTVVLICTITLAVMVATYGLVLGFGWLSAKSITELLQRIIRVSQSVVGNAGADDLSATVERNVIESLNTQAAENDSEVRFLASLVYKLVTGIGHKAKAGKVSQQEAFEHGLTAENKPWKGITEAPQSVFRWRRPVQDTAVQQAPLPGSNASGTFPPVGGANQPAEEVSPSHSSGSGGAIEMAEMDGGDEDKNKNMGDGAGDAAGAEGESGQA